MQVPGRWVGIPIRSAMFIASDPAPARDASTGLLAEIIDMLYHVEAGQESKRGNIDGWIYSRALAAYQ